MHCRFILIQLTLKMIIVLGQSLINIDTLIQFIGAIYPLLDQIVLLQSILLKAYGMCSYFIGSLHYKLHVAILCFFFCNVLLKLSIVKLHAMVVSFNVQSSFARFCKLYYELGYRHASSCWCREVSLSKCCSICCNILKAVHQNKFLLPMTKSE